ncbi:YdeI/OmpD-associated family protein [Salinibacterium sp. G-O1]|uniref:YdeI/OmpD-associated family protein n=1 Tax=Salinibacterium sp. G-O1 TaxID=3046208 RepID=UPI0024B9F4D8|nr:YdeI/OmpD-associated family protein [Salinibacterium sp. G-O1]MDJ0334242.1 YdeI/OmpD-associated family protein [Salinibacterium sp. G-O1]
MAAIADRPLLEFDVVAQWEAWLADELDHNGVRLRLRKKGTTLPGITYAEALDVALCQGWIDGQAGSIDADYYFVSFSPRRTRSPWSQINQGHVARLITAGRMRPAGLAEIDRAKADGRWDAAYRQKDAVVPADLQAALDANPAASTMFGTLTVQNRWAMLFRLANVKRETTRQSKIATFIEMLERGETFHPQKAKGPQAEA